MLLMCVKEEVRVFKVTVLPLLLVPFPSSPWWQLCALARLREHVCVCGIYISLYKACSTCG